ncbi:type VII secretion-associated serine protease mycosin [Paractinoplanes durhamensis]|uniref:type VII secretion-associated serine protease mycosin n=1 Tax=Paractinoplanes durhamensis TaxID=113563 RepID=UPI001944BF12|nr:type VII secretion-associated serine protease mycosin [Actinoplanes durhamensis]
MTAAPALADSTRDQQWYLTDLKIAEAHKITKGAGVIVALIDSGVDPKHPDLAGALLPGLDTTESNLAGREGTEDTDGHGTGMAGIIAGRGHGAGAGVLGIAPAAKILPIATGGTGFQSSSFMTKAVDFAIKQHAGVINMSFGGADDDTVHDAIRKAQAADIVLVAAAGNDNSIGNTAGQYPGRYPEVLAVGAYGKDRKIASISITGPHVDLVAPGDQIMSTSIFDRGYEVSGGTSDATAMVSGAAALLRAKYPDMSAAEVVHRLTATADDAGPAGRDDTYGNGLLDVVKALTADVAPLPAAGASAAPSDDAAQAAPPAASDSDDLPEPVGVLVPALIVAGVVLLIGVVVVVFMMRRRRSG